MIAKLVAICVALLLLGSAVQAADFHVAATATVELDAPAIDFVPAPAEPVTTVAAPRHASLVGTPPPLAPVTSAFTLPMDRPPRS